jgi:O-antigen/teichoic acid export membrane protein
MEAISQSHLDFKGVFAGYFVRQVVFFCIVCYHAIFKVPIELHQLSIYWSISIFTGTIFIYWYSRPHLHNKFNPSLAWIKKITGYGKYIFASGLISNLYTNMDQLMTAGVMKLPAVVASYSISNRINTVIDVPSFAAADVIFPKVSMASAQEGEGKVKYLYERMVALLSCFVVPLTLVIIIFAKWVVLLVGGTQYVQQATPILQLYMITGLLRPMQNQAANLLNSIGKPALCFILNAVTLGANLFISYLCIKHFGYIGAAIASVFTYGLSLPVWYYVVKRLVGAEARNIIAYMREFYSLFFNKGVGLLKGLK